MVSGERGEAESEDDEYLPTSVESGRCGRVSQGGLVKRRSR